jgi:hypothetical protein
MITATVDSKPISATVSGNRIVGSMGASLVVTSAAGGVGPQGPQGTPGSALSSASDVALSGVADGDVLRYSNSRWRNYPEDDLLDAGNF